MNHRISSLSAMAAAVLFCLSIPALGQVTINFTGVANPSVQALGDYAGFYTGTVNGSTETPGFICDDYNNDIYVPESWQATATPFSSLVSGKTVNSAALKSTLFGSTIGIDGYAALAYLSNLMASTPASGQGDIAAAIWYIGALGTGSYTNVLLGMDDSISWSSLSQTAQNYVTNLLGSGSNVLYGVVGGPTGTEAAMTELQSSDLWLYTPIAGTQTAGRPYPQEFIGVPEGGAAWMYLFLAAGACGAAMLLSLAVPEGGASLLYILFASVACVGAIFLGRRKLLARQK